MGSYEAQSHKAEALNEARTELLGDNLADRFAVLEKQDEVERLLEVLKAEGLKALADRALDKTGY